MKSIFKQEDRAEIISRINTLNAASKAQWGRMTVGQMLRHCALCEAYYMGNIEVKRSLLGRIFGKMAINSILKNEHVPFPKNSAAPAQFRVTENISHIEEEKQKWLSQIEQYANYNDDYFTHWFFGKMTKEQLGQFVYKHSDHHLKQFGS
jgi:hypothetical protein